MPLIKEKKQELWINNDYRLKDYISRTACIYKDNPIFIKNGRKKYLAKLNINKLTSVSNNMKEAYFELDLNQKRNGVFKDFFFLKIIDKNNDVNTIKLF